MLLQKNKSCLLIIDVQEKLTPHVRRAKTVVNRCHWLMKLANEIDVPLIVSEQYSKGLQKTVEPLRGLIPKGMKIDKVHFSCCRDPSFNRHWKTVKRNMVVVAGLETHVCVFQTVMDLKKEGFEVFVVADAVSSRHEIDHEYGLKRMVQEGIHLVTAEMVFFEWVEKAATPEFKELSKKFLR